MADLFGDGSDSDSTNILKLNKDYAKKYDQWRQKEELQKLKDRYGEDATLTSSSSEPSEDEEELTSEVEKKFLETLSALKSKDPKIYNKDVVFFEEPRDDAEGTKKIRKKEQKPMYLKDYERKIIVEKEGKLSDEDDDDDNGGNKDLKHNTYATAAEEEELKHSFKAVLHSSNSSDDDDDGALLTARQKSKKEQEEKEEEYVQWLKGEVERVGKEDEAKKLGYLQKYWNSGKLEESEKFLRDFILNKRYLEKNERTAALDEDDLSEDEAALEQQDTFEHKYNYRFEEPDQEFIKKYPRTLQNSMRRKNESRKQKRQEIRQRKLEEKKQKCEELNQLKALKRRGIQEKIQKLKQITGNDELGFADVDIEGDFDPEEYDRRMNDIFNSEYYSQECEEHKPENLSDEEFEYEDWDNWQGQDESGSQAGEEASDEHHAASNRSQDVSREEWDERFSNQDVQRHGKNWKKSHFAQTISRRKPLFNPAEKSFQEYFDEYYKLDYEDIIGGMPTRFHYRQVTPNDFGLSVEEILAAKDQELNKWCPVKRTCLYRPENEERQDVENFRKRANNFSLKRKVFTSLCKQDEPEESAKPGAPAPPTAEVTYSESKKRKRRRKKMKQEDDTGAVAAGEEGAAVPAAVEEGKAGAAEQDGTRSKKRKKVAEKNIEAPGSVNGQELSSDRLPKQQQSTTEKKTQRRNVNQLMSQAIGQSKRSTKKRRRTANSDGTPNTVSKKNVAAVLKVSDNRLWAYGLNPKKVHKQIIYGGKKNKK